MSTLRTRAATFLMGLDAAGRDSARVDDLIAFVIAEIGRKADAALDQSLPLCLYFPSVDDREGFIEAFLEAKPNVISRKLP